ncbi:MAG: tryptophan 7-halogenase [Proteobacteria bacterium]|nr:tryptophan 7-halogenase [Pseudomonadota bacterium]
MTEATGAEPCDVLVIGGGPAGSTAAALLAERGLDVVLLEKDAHPRFHIGESLLPQNLRILERLGLAEDVARIGVHKPGAEFFSDISGENVAFPFARSLDQSYTHAYQVRRSEFDKLLFENAGRRGARTAEHSRVTDLALAPAPGERARATVATPDGTRELAPRFVLDASGRDTFLGNRLRNKVSNKHINNAAVFAHYRGVAQRDGDRAGYISVHLAEDGWFWMIPLTGGVMSVGFVGTQSAFRQRETSNEEFLERRLRESPTAHARMLNAERISEVHATGNYSYRATKSWGEGWAMIGDAFAFIDPVFSSGVLLAMTAGELGANTAQTWLRDPAAGRAAAQAAELRLRRDMDSLSWLIYRINCPVLRHMFMSPSNRFRMRDGIVTMLAGSFSRGRMSLPVLAVKAVYYTLQGARRLGWSPPPAAAA